MKLPLLGRNSSKQHHHSTGDWDFESAVWGLDPSDYISSPSCLQLGWDENKPFGYVVLNRNSDTQAIDQGRLVTWVKTYPSLTFPTYGILVFRAQAALGSATRNNSYWILFGTGGFSWRYRDSAGNDTTIGGYVFGFAANTWTKVRVTWWNGKDPQNNDATVCRFEAMVGGIWAPEPDLYDTNQRNKGSATNRVGIGQAGGYYSEWTKYDDTEIWCTA